MIAEGNKAIHTGWRIIRSLHLRLPGDIVEWLKMEWLKMEWLKMEWLKIEKEIGGPEPARWAPMSCDAGGKPRQEFSQGVGCGDCSRGHSSRDAHDLRRSAARNMVRGAVLEKIPRGRADKTRASFDRYNILRESGTGLFTAKKDAHLDSLKEALLRPRIILNKSAQSNHGFIVKRMELICLVSSRFDHGLTTLLDATSGAP